MSNAIEDRIRELGLTLPAAAAPAANYVPFTRSGNTLYVSGQLPMRDGKVAVTGKLGGGVSLEDGQEAARLCALNILAQAKAATGDLGRIRQVLKLGGFVNATPAFTEHPKVVNGASNLMVEVLGDAGRHARFAVAAPGLPFDAAVEVDAVIELA